MRIGQCFQRRRNTDGHGELAFVCGADNLHRVTGGGRRVPRWSTRIVAKETCSCSGVFKVTKTFRDIPSTGRRLLARPEDQRSGLRHVRSPMALLPPRDLQQAFTKVQRLTRQPTELSPWVPLVQACRPKARLVQAFAVLRSRSDVSRYP